MGSLLIMLALFMTCLMGLTSLIFGIRNYDLAQSTCIHHALKAQRSMKQQLHLLMKLNLPAQHLRKMYNRLHKLYIQSIRSGRLIIASQLKLQLFFIKQKRRLLDNQQKNILRNSLKTTENIFTSFKKDMSRLSAQHLHQYHHRPFPLAVKASPRGSLAPSYQPLSHFAKQQKFSLAWKMPLYHGLPPWLKKVFFKDGLSSYICSTTLHGKPGKWKIQLSQ